VQPGGKSCGQQAAGAEGGVRARDGNAAPDITCTRGPGCSCSVHLQHRVQDRQGGGTIFQFFILQRTNFQYLADATIALIASQWTTLDVLINNVTTCLSCNISTERQFKDRGARKVSDWAVHWQLVALGVLPLLRLHKGTGAIDVKLLCVTNSLNEAQSPAFGTF
jgi:hypothetical protein